MSQHPRITGIGYCGMDHLCLLPRIPIDDKVQILESRIQGGGPSATAVVAAARLGARAAFAGAVGDDASGRQIIDGLAAEGVDPRSIRVRQGAASATAFCWIDRGTGKRSIAWTEGTAPALRPDELDAELIRRSDLLHLDGHQGAAAFAAAEIAREAGVAVSLDAGTVVPGIERLLELSDIVIASEPFAEQVAGTRDPAAAARALFHARCRFSAVTAGADGAVGYTGAEILRRPAFPVEAVDTTGAGDAFHGGFAFEFARGGTWERCLRLASAVAALNCTRLGGRAGLPDLETAERFLAHHE